MQELPAGFFGKDKRRYLTVAEYFGGGRRVVPFDDPSVYSDELGGVLLHLAREGRVCDVTLHGARDCKFPDSVVKEKRGGKFSLVSGGKKYDAGRMLTDLTLGLPGYDDFHSFSRATIVIF